MARIVLGYTTLTAPFDGVILVRQAELGEIALPGTPVVTLADLDHVWLRAYVNETDIGRVRSGRGGDVTTDTYPGKSYRGPHLLHLAGGRVHAQDRRDPCRARDPGLPHPDRHRQSDARAGAGDAGGCAVDPAAAGLTNGRHCSQCRRGRQGSASALARVTAVDALSFTVAARRDIRPGGPDGAGKTTIMRMLAGVMTRRRRDRRSTASMWCGIRSAPSCTSATCRSASASTRT